MKILVIGGGGREHALAWKLRQSPQTKHLWCAPGNGGISQLAECVPVDVKDISALVALGKSLKPDLTVVGPEVPLVLGVVDEFAAASLPIIGPTRQAARLEGSKFFAKEFMTRHGIPTAPLYGFYDSPGEAYTALCAVDWPVVIKADGLCAGKGVQVSPTPDDATAFIERLMEKRELGEGGLHVLMEEALEGQELSYIVLADGEHFLTLLASRDHKRALDGDKGPNTGGMGAYTSDDLLPRDLEETILAQIVRPSLEGLATEGTPYKGFLYFGLMLTSAGPRVLEFNCRMGDPETQPIVARMDFDLLEAIQALAAGELNRVKAAWKPGASTCVVMASGGYPGDFEAGKAIKGLTEAEKTPGVAVFHAGTRRDGNNYYTSGGRVLGVTSSGANLGEAAARTYDAVSKISFPGAHFRRDIAASAQARAGN